MSFTRGVSFHHETNASSQPNITNNISINASNELKSDNPYTSVESAEVSQQIQYPPQVEQASIPNEKEFLKKVLRIYMSQKVIISGKFIVCSVDELKDLILTLLPGCSIDVVIGDIEVDCCGVAQNVPYAKIDAIWVDKGDMKVSFKYAYSNLVGELERYNISTKYVRSNQ